ADAEDFLLLGKALLRGGQEAPGVRMLERAREASPENCEVLKTLGKTYRRLGFPIASVEEFQRLAAIDPTDVECQWFLGLLLLELDQPLRAADALSFVVKHDPSGQSAREAPVAIRKQLVQAWLRSEQPSLARNVLEPLLVQESDSE